MGMMAGFWDGRVMASVLSFVRLRLDEGWERCFQSKLWSLDCFEKALRVLNLCFGRMAMDSGACVSCYCLCFGVNIDRWK